MDVVVALGGGSSTRHSCKVCRKGFPCGRSLGGHMRSHSLVEVAAVDDDDDDATSDADADDDDEPGGARGSNGVAAASGGGGYGLRENPKKTRRFSGLDGGGDAHGEGECRGDRGEPFPSCRPALRRHAPEEVGGYAGGEDDVGVEVVAKWEKDEEEDEDMAMVPSEAAVLMPAPRRRRRSMRVPAPAPPPPAAARDAFDGEPEDVALCLIMLSRDTPPGRCMHADYSPETNRRRRDGGVARNGYHHHHHHHADSDDGASALFHYADVETTRSGKTRKPAGPIAGAGEEKRGRYECPGCGRVFQSYQALGGHRASHKRINSSCSVTKVVAPPDQPEPSAKITSSFSTASALASPDVGGAADTVVLAVKAKKVSSKFECPICFKVFGSGQALGGHKRSHSIAGELYERAHADNDAGIVEPEQSVMAVRFLDLNLPAPGAEE